MLFFIDWERDPFVPIVDKPNKQGEEQGIRLAGLLSKMSFTEKTASSQGIN